MDSELWAKRRHVKRESCLFFVGGVKVKIEDFQIRQNLIEPQFIPGPPYTFRSCPYGSKTSIHTVYDFLGQTSQKWKLPFLHRRRQSQNTRFSNSPKSEKSDWAAIYSRAPLHIQKLSLWLKGLYLYSIRLFRSDMPKVKVAFSSSKPSKSDQIHKKSETVNFLTRTSFTLESSYFG